MDQLFLEAEGNRQIANQIAQRAFLAHQDILPTGQKVLYHWISVHCHGKLHCIKKHVLVFPFL